MAPKKRKAAEDGSTAQKKAKASLSTRITRNMTIDGPRQAVFNTAELLEQILLYLPAKNVFGVQRVSRQFRDVVATSTAIQQKLFLRPSGGESVKWIACRTERGLGTNWPLWLEYLDYRFAIYDDTKHANVEGIRFVPAKLNPLLRLQDWSRNNSAQRVCYEKTEHVIAIFNVQLGRRSSWRNTFLTDPPCQSASVSMNWSVGKGLKTHGQQHHSVHDPNGLTLGTVMDAVLQERQSVSYRIGDEIYVKEGAILHNLLQTLSAGKRKKAITVDALGIYFEGVVIPTEKEWAEVK